MKNLFKTWTLNRFLYLAAGIFFVLIATNDRVWFMIPFGLYFIAMAIFKFGCAGGACQIPLKKKEEHSN
ncbi:hypothetical protein Q73A0000_13205 [Kaistella flava (ex Peng et al. 2021)]|uniref:DUF2892 domain-containing protein n=1 Tax=Kaistella flava (ex Peng et al. 2021) TaxID=2038776 RepID=A0A7M2YBN3_9FLAO|nr:hypothetical protein [Kaistella flava (ex Peng et al. 2021)]QOW11249.1 hypothetical protein Q73A0000_13205 [Kaistella flava (ex Peng et al. 2021)]